MSIEAVAVPEFVDEPGSALVPGSRIKAAQAMAFFSVSASPWRERARFDFYFDLVAKLPSFRYRLGRDIEALIEPLDRHLSQVRSLSA